MRSRPLLILAALLLLLAGGVFTWLLLSIPNDLHADALLKEARENIKSGHREEAREKLLAVVQQFPRTDAGATALAILFRMVDEDRDGIRSQIDEINGDRKRTAATLKKMSQPVITTIAAPAATPSPEAAPTPGASPSPTPAAKKPPAKATNSPAVRRKTPTRRH
ncbi:MAG: hypothetical protein ABI718_02145 [Acidobacteriota bacterium]